ncbi:hypothetical protein D9613_001371 [Agrocybe pediades]|uniref:F-box domain-containing protein n=1 Tax=Agrocybe pediades TaxID=84607 RepID=A0A8H4VUJ6_9AGAR|nr:hypothetical protein D9613_001371 [Agrocybe pediades]
MTERSRPMHLIRNTFPSLPVEVWTSAWNLVSSKEDLKSLSLTCRLFRDICQPSVFAEVKHTNDRFRYAPPGIGISWWIEDADYAVRRIYGLSQHPIHRHSVKMVHFEGLREGSLSSPSHRTQVELSARYRTLISTYLLALKSFTRLREVVLQSAIVVDDDVALALSNLKFMDRLRIIDCAYSCSKPVSPSITVKELFLSNFAPTVKLFSNKRLHVLSLYGFSVPLLSHFMTEGINNHLTDIFIALGARDSMITVTAFLGSCPVLERLRLSSRLPLSDPPQLCLPANALPRLSSYSGPAYFATSIIPGRPVQDIETTDHRGMNLQQNDIEMEHFLGSLHRSTGHIRKLHICHIPLSATTLVFIFQFFPRLRSLEVGFDRSTARKDQFPITAHDRDELALVREHGCGPASACSWQDTGGGDDGSLKVRLLSPVSLIICLSH